MQHNFGNQIIEVDDWQLETNVMAMMQKPTIDTTKDAVHVFTLPITKAKHAGVIKNQT